MKIFDFLFGRKVEMEHDFFGKMVFRQHKRDAGKSYFECRRIFMPSGRFLEMSVVAGESGPTQEQADFFNTLEQRYPELVDALMPWILPEYQKLHAERHASSFGLHIVPAFLWLGDCRQHPVAWEIGFELPDTRSDIFTFIMSDYNVVSMTS